MLFNSFHFFIFFIIVLIAASVLRKYNKKAEIWFLVVASAYFYGQWNWTYILLIYVTVVVDFYLGLKCFTKENSSRYLNISLLVNLGILGFFKYINFIFETTNDIITVTGSSYQLEFFEILLPVGISFYTFQSLSYTIDIHRNQLTPRTKISEYALFISFFPQLVAGPIVRASEFFEQLDSKRSFSFSMMQSGYFLIVLGLLKKIVFADNLALIADPVFENPENYDSFETAIGVYAFTFQIYFDFSGYTDMAIGIARLLGFKFPRNFSHPYIATSIKDFWRRWHMTLSRWLRDYLYISLGGNRKGQFATMRNLFITMFLGGLWHGASWNFAIWGILHGVYLAIGKLIEQFNVPIALPKKLSDFIKWVIVFHLVVLSWIFFRADNLTESVQIIYNIAAFSLTSPIKAQGIVTALIIAFFMLLHWIGSKLDLTIRCESMKVKEYVFWIVIFKIVILFFSVTSTESFIYFQF